MIDVGGGSHALEAITFDASTTASEIRLVGAGEGTELRLSEQQGSGATLFTVHDGAPPIYLQALSLSGSVRVEGGRLEATRCVFGPARTQSQRLRRLQGTESPRPSQRALTVVGGEAIVEHATFFNVTGGAIAVEVDGSLQLRDSLLSSNSAEFGGAVIVSGGRAVLERCLIENNRAVVAGGGLYVTDGGQVQLKNQTLLRGNEASRERSISFVAAVVTYELPAPLAHYVFMVGSASVTLLTSPFNVDFPFPCPGGVVGDSYATLAQSGPWCSGVCPAGFVCEAGTDVPEICPPGERVKNTWGHLVALKCIANSQTTHELTVFAPFALF